MIQFAYEIDNDTDRVLRSGLKCSILRDISHFLVSCINLANISISIVILLLVCCNIFYYKINIFKNMFFIFAQLAMYIIINNLHRYEAIRYWLVKERLSNTIS